MVNRDPRTRPPAAKPPRKPPPNYFARSVQFRMLVLVFSFMAVLMLMSKAGDPRTWSWMWGSDYVDADSRENAPGPTAGDSLDTRPPSRREEETSVGPLVEMGERSAAPMEIRVEQLPESLNTAQLDGWDSVLTSLDRDQAMLLREVLWHARHNRPLDEGQQVAWSQLLAQLDALWRDYHTRALLAAATNRDELTDEQKRVYLEVLELSKSTWDAQRNALATVADPAEITVGQREQLAQLQLVLDQRALGQVRDNTVLLPTDNEAWFRLWDRLKSDDVTGSARPSKPVTFVQLFSQPDEYRGQLVEVRGLARMAYHVRAPRNPFGIDGYYVFAVLPAEGGDSPFIVYCLDTPEGFPEIKDRDVDRQTTTLRDDVQFTGYFFKRWVYPSHGGPNLAPLLLARLTDWTPRPTATTASDRPPKFGSIALALLVTALLATGIAWGVYRRSQWSAADVYPRAASDTMVPFDDQQVRPGVSQQLQQLAGRSPVPHSRQREEE